MASLLVPAFILLATIAIPYFLFRGGGKISAARRTQLAKARPGEARIIRVSDAIRHRGPNRVPLVRILMQVAAVEGPSYEVSTTWYVEQMGIPRAQPGQELSVLIDAENREIIYPSPADGCFEYAWAEQDALAFSA